MARLLVVDDDPNIRALMREALVPEGHDVQEAEDGSVALSMIEAGDIDLVLLDLQMPGMDGWLFLDELYARDLRRLVRVVIVSGYAGARPSRLNDRFIVSKPFALADLLATIDAALASDPCDIWQRREDRLVRIVGRVDALLR